MNRPSTIDPARLYTIRDAIRVLALSETAIRNRIHDGPPDEDEADAADYRWGSVQVRKFNVWPTRAAAAAKRNPETHP